MKRLHFALAAAIVASGCSSLSPAEDPTALRMQDLEARLIRIERVMENQSLVQLSSELERLRSETTALRGEIETLRFESENSDRRQRELYVDAARVFGASLGRILWKHIVPNAIQPVIVQVTLLLAVALLAEASLSFLGLGVQPPNPSWGGMLARAYHYMEIAPDQMYAPGLAILLTALAFNALGESLRVALDPTMKRR